MQSDKDHARNGYFSPCIGTERFLVGVSLLHAVIQGPSPKAAPPGRTVSFTFPLPGSSHTAVSNLREEGTRTPIAYPGKEESGFDEQLTTSAV